MIKTILVDDEPLVLEELRELLESQDNVMVMASYADPLQALRELPDTRPDCAFLDIEMPGITGIELAEQFLSVNPNTDVVFVTAYNHYATQAFDVSALDYLLKPIRPERINKALEKIENKMTRMTQTATGTCVIRSFGSFDILVDGRLVKWSRYKSKELLAYLLQNEGHPLSKFRLCEEQWAEYEPEQALAYLQTAVYALRKSLRETGCTQITIEYSGDRYFARVHEDAEWDLRQFNKDFERAVQTDSRKLAQKLARLYRGEYLEGEDWPWSDIAREDYACKQETLQKLLQMEADLTDKVLA